MIEHAIREMLTLFPSHTVYIHNLANFDSYYINKPLLKYASVTPQYRESRLIKLTGVYNQPLVNNDKDTVDVNSKNNKLRIVFKDSYALFPLSLEALIKSLNVKTGKLSFPYYFPTEDNLKCIGKFTDYDCFDTIKVSIKEYDVLAADYKDKLWDLQLETKAYIYNDVRGLYECLLVMGNETFRSERVNITDISTASSLALTIYLSNYYDKTTPPRSVVSGY